MMSTTNQANAVRQERWQDPSKAVEILDKLRRDLRFLTFYLSPNMANFQESPEWFQEAFGLSPQESLALREELFSVGFWVRDLAGNIHTHQPRLGLGKRGETITALEAVTMVTQITNHLSDKDRYCNATVHTVVTSHEQKREFNSKIDLAVRSLLDGSRAAPGETTFSFAVLILDTMKAMLNEEQL